MKDTNEASPPVLAMATAKATGAACRNCGTALAAREYYCPDCDTPHFPHLKSALVAPGVRGLAFFLVIAGPVAVYTLWEAIQRIAFKM